MLRLVRIPSNNAVSDWSPGLAQHELSPKEAHAYLMSIRSQTRSFSGPPPVNPDTDGVVFYTSAQGIGDAVTCLYAACGIANAGYKVTYHTRHPEWLAKASHPGVTIEPMPQHEAGANCNLDYGAELKAAFEGTLPWRSSWKVRNLAAAYRLRDGIDPAVPYEIMPPDDPIVAGDYAVFAPFSLHDVRQWPIGHWARLAIMLKEKSLPTVVMVPAEQDARAREVFQYSKVFVPSINEALNLIGNAQILVGNDSGPAHISGLLRKKTVCIQAQTKATHVFSPARVTGVYPGEREECRFCYWQEAGGKVHSCSVSCYALMTISPYEVLETVLLELGKPGTIRIRKGRHARV